MSPLTIATVVTILSENYLIKSIMSLTALLLGGTGETGQMVLKHLTKDPKVTKVIFITRRNVDLPEEQNLLTLYGHRNMEMQFFRKQSKAYE